MTPVLLLMLRVSGRPVADHWYGCTPPVASTCAEYELLTGPVGSDPVVIRRAAAWIVKGRVTLAFWCGLLASVTEITTENAPPALGLPEIKPLLLTDNPVGNPVADQ